MAAHCLPQYCVKRHGVQIDRKGRVSCFDTVVKGYDDQDVCEAGPEAETAKFRENLARTQPTDVWQPRRTSTRDGTTSSLDRVHVSAKP